MMHQGRQTVGKKRGGVQGLEVSGVGSENPYCPWIVVWFPCLRMWASVKTETREINGPQGFKSFSAARQWKVALSHSFSQS